jgi:hypothetical protein
MRVVAVTSIATRVPPADRGRPTSTRVIVAVSAARS